MIEEPIEEVYFNWLYSKVASVENPTPSLTYLKLLRQLHQTEFVWIISGDDNRAEDGLELRREFLNQSRMQYDRSWMLVGCSVLEMLVAFAKRAQWETDIPTREWFWIFLQNLHLDGFNDSLEGFGQEVASILDCFIWRTYDHNGNGGMLPLNFSLHDQRKVEIWYQFEEFLVQLELE